MVLPIIWQVQYELNQFESNKLQNQNSIVKKKKCFPGS